MNKKLQSEWQRVKKELCEGKDLRGFGKPLPGTKSFSYAKAFAELNHRKATWPTAIHTMTKINHGQFEVKSNWKPWRWKVDEDALQKDAETIRLTVREDSGGVLPFLQSWTELIRSSNQDTTEE